MVSLQVDIAMASAQLDHFKQRLLKELQLLTAFLEEQQRRFQQVMPALQMPVFAQCQRGAEVQQKLSLWLLDYSCEVLVRKQEDMLRELSSMQLHKENETRKASSPLKENRPPSAGPNQEAAGSDVPLR